MIPITSSEMLGKTLRSYRVKAGLNQTEAGKKFNIPQKTISRIESGMSANLETLFKYMSALGLEMHLEPRHKPQKNKAIW